MRQYFYAIIILATAILSANSFSIETAFVPKINTNDINQNGHLDFIALDGEIVHRSVSLYEIVSESSLNKMWSYSVENQQNEIIDATFGDLDGDGNPELLLVINTEESALLHIFQLTPTGFSTNPTISSPIPIKDNSQLFPKKCALLHWDDDPDYEFAINFGGPKRFVVVGDFEKNKLITLSKPGIDFVNNTVNSLDIYTLQTENIKEQSLLIVNNGDETTGFLASKKTSSVVNTQILPITTKSIFSNNLVQLEDKSIYSSNTNSIVFSSSEILLGIEKINIDGIPLTLLIQNNGDIVRTINDLPSEIITPIFFSEDISNVNYLIFSNTQNLLVVHGGHSPELAIISLGLSVDPSLQKTDSRTAQKIIPLNTTFEYSLQTDTSSQLIAFESHNIPKGLQLDEETFSIQWTPGLNALGYHELRFDSKYRIDGKLVKQVDDSDVSFSRKDSSFTQSDTLLLYVNDPPKIFNTTEEYLVISGDTIQIPIKILDRNIDTNIDLQVNSNQSNYLIVSDTTFQWIPDLEAGSGTFEVVVLDEFALDSYQFNIVVHPKIFITPPPANLTTEVNKEFEFIPEISQIGEDQTKEYELLYAPENMYVDAQGIIRWIPLITQVDSHNITLIVSDGITSSSVDIEIFVNAPPVIAQRPPVNTILKEGEAFHTKLTSFDSNSLPSMEWKLLSSPEGMVLDGAGTLNWNPTQIGLSTYTVELSDEFTSTSFTGTIYVNKLPKIISQPPSFINLGDTLRYNLVFEDENTLSIDNAPFEHLTLLTQSPNNVELIENNLLEWIPQENQFGNQMFIISIFDGVETVNHSFEVFVNDIPKITSDNAIKVKSGEKLKHKIIVKDSNNDNQSFTISPIISDSTYTYSSVKLDENTGELMWETSHSDLGHHNFEIKISDGHPTSRTSQNLSILVYDSPKITNSMEPEAFVGMDYLFTPQAENMFGKKEVFSDIFLDMKHSTSPNIMFLDTAGVLLWTPTQEDVGIQTVQLIVTDQFGTTSDYNYSIQVFENPCDPCDNEVKVTPPEKEEH